MFPYIVKYRYDSDSTKERRSAVVLASDKNEARRKIDAYNVNEERKSCIYIYSIELMDENKIFDVFEEDLYYEDWMG